MNFYVQDVKSPRSWKSKHGNQMLSYDVTVNSQNGVEEVELTQKADTPPPKPGDTIVGHIEPSHDPIKYPPKLKKDPPPNRQGSNGGANTRSFGGDRNQDSIERQVAFKGAVEIMVGMNPEGIPLDAIKNNLTELFEHGLGLIQKGNVHSSAPVTGPPAPDPDDPGPQEPPPPRPNPPQGSDVSAADVRLSIPIDAIRDAYRGFQNQHGPERADAQWRQKLTSMGLTPQTLEQATHDQRADLLAFLDDIPF